MVNTREQARQEKQAQWRAAVEHLLRDTNLEDPVRKSESGEIALARQQYAPEAEPERPVTRAQSPHRDHKKEKAQIQRILTEQIGHISGRHIRDALRKLRRHGHPFTSLELGATLGIENANAHALLGEMRTAKLVEPMAGAEDPDIWYGTPEGSRFAAARATKPITRTTAEKALQACVQRIRELNEAPQHAANMYRITQAAVFGSYLDTVATRSDVDVAVELALRMSGAEYMARHQITGLQALAAIEHDKNTVRRLLRTGARAIHVAYEFEWPNDPLVLNVEHRMIYIL